jgi:IS605 OrfB family transposase
MRYIAQFLDDAGAVVRELYADAHSLGGAVELITGLEGPHPRSEWCSETRLETKCYTKSLKGRLSPPDFPNQPRSDSEMRRRFEMAAPISLRDDFDGPILRAIVLAEKAGSVTRRLLSLVTIYDGGDRFGRIAVEDLNVRGLARGFNAKDVNEAACGKLVSMIAYKAENAGCELIKVDPRWTSQTYPECGIIACRH